jgi:hypothetical protein
LFHSIWYATSVGIMSSRSDGLGIETASVASPSQRHSRRRPGAETLRQPSTPPGTWAANCSGSCPSSTRSTRAMQAGRRWTA